LEGDSGLERLIDVFYGQQTVDTGSLMSQCKQAHHHDKGHIPRIAWVAQLNTMPIDKMTNAC
jgi:hypothetical protein